jgi:hypothetical protein
VEPAVVVPSGDDLLLAGKPTYVWSISRGRIPGLVSHNRLFGVIVNGRGIATTVAAPRAGRIKPLAAHAIGRSAWGVIFAEITPGTDTTDWWWGGDSTGSRTVALWYGQLRNNRWSAQQKLPLHPDVIRLSHTAGSRMITVGDTTVWAVPEQTADFARTAIYERVGKRWTRQRLDFSPAGITSYLALEHLPGHGFVLALVAPDASLRIDQNSLFLHLRSSGWSRLRRLVTGINEEVHFPSLVRLAGDSLNVTWLTPVGASHLKVRSMRGDVVKSNPPVITIDSITREKAWAVGGPQGMPYWLSRHSPPSQPEARLTLWSATGGVAHPVWSTPHPYTGLFYVTPTVTAAGGVTITGPLLDVTRETLTTLLIQLQFDCSTRGIPNGGDGSM